MALTVNDRLHAIAKLAIQDDDGRWDAQEIGMLSHAARTRDSDTFSKEGVAFMTAVFNNPKTQYVGDARKSLLSVLVQQAKVDASTLEGVTPDPVRLTFVSGSSSKFYELAVNGKDLEIRYGKIGTEGQTQTKSFPSEKAAIKEYAKKLAEKEKEGYLRDGAKSESAGETQAVKPGGKTKTCVIEMDYGQVDDLISKHYGHDYEVVASEEWGNDSQHKIEVDGEVDKWDADSVKEFAESGSGSFILGALLNDLASKGELEKGTYLISVCW